MKVTKIALEDRSGAGKRRGVRTIEFDAGRLASVRQAVEQLDGEDRTLLSFEAEAGELVIGGGNEGRHYFVTVTFGDEHSGPVRCLTLLSGPPDAEASEEDGIDIVTGGQSVNCPPWEIVDKSMAIAAAKYWCQHGEASPAFAWLETTWDSRGPRERVIPAET